MPEEILSCFDEQGNEIESQPRSEVLKEPRRWWCGAGDTFVVNRNGQLLCSQRSNLVNGMPGKWQSLFGGHVKAGKSFIETARDELEEESGISVSVENLHYVSRRPYAPQKYIHEYYLYIAESSDIKITLDPDEVTKCQWLSFEEYSKDVAKNPEKWTNACIPEDQEIIKQLLQKF